MNIILQLKIDMKQFARLLLIGLIFSACNAKDQEKAIVSPDPPSPEKMMRAAIARFPDSLLLKENLIQYFRESGRYELAIPITDTALQYDSNNARLWYIKGTLHFENEDTVQAIQALENAVRISPQPDYLISLGTLYAETKNPRALKIAGLLQMNKTAGTDKEALFITGLFYNYAGEKQKAISYFDQCLALDYTHMNAYREKAIALYDEGKYAAALSVLEKAVTLQNSFDEGHYWRGRCLEKLNKTMDAIEAYQAALMYNPGYVEAEDALKRLGVR